MALTICGVKTPQAPGRSTLLRPELMQLDAWEAADETPKLPYLPQFYFRSMILVMTHRAPGISLLTGKVIHRKSDCFEFPFVL